MTDPSIYQQTLRHFLAPVVPLLDDPTVSEIMIVGPECVYYETGGTLQRASVRFADASSLAAAVRNIAEYVGRNLDERHHSMDGRLPTGERVHAIIPPAARNGICLTIRKFQRCFFGLKQLTTHGTLCPMASEFLEIAVRLHKNMVVSGGTGTGKTTLLNALSTAIPEHERIIVIEDSAELQLQQPHTIYLEAQPGRPPGQPGVTIRDLFVDSLRMRPDRIVVGEVRRGEALDLVQSMISGHAGSLSTIHANTPRDAVSRLETLCLLSDAELPIYVARSQVASALDLVVQLARLPDGSRRVTLISECLGLDQEQRFVWNDLFEFRAFGLDGEGRLRGELAPTGASPSFRDEPKALGMDADLVICRGLFATTC